MNNNKTSLSLSVGNTNNNNQQQHHQQQQQQQITGTPLDGPADCTIACDKGHLTAHKLVLCDHSKYLQDILSKFPTAEHPIIILTELNYMDIKVLVQYMYTGELVIADDCSPTSLLRAAQILKIDSLTADVDDDIDEDDDDVLERYDDDRERDDDEEDDALTMEDDGVCDDVDLNDMVADANSINSNPINHIRNNNNNNNNNNIKNHINTNSLLINSISPDDLDDEDDDLDEDEDDDLMNEQGLDELDNVVAGHSISNNNSKLINSIRNIYSLNQFINTSSSPPPHLNLLHNNSNNNINHNHHNIINNNNNNNHHHHHLSQHHHNHHHQQQQHHHQPPLSAASTIPGSNNIATSSSSSSGSGSLSKIRCHLCNIGLSDVKCLYRHVLTRHLPEKWGYKCEFCDREFSRDDHLMRHYTTKHKNMEFNREKIRETRRLNREMAKNFHDQISTN